MVLFDYFWLRWIKFHRHGAKHNHDEGVYAGFRRQCFRFHLCSQLLFEFADHDDDVSKGNGNGSLHHHAAGYPQRHHREDHSLLGGGHRLRSAQRRVIEQ